MNTRFVKITLSLMLSLGVILSAFAQGPAGAGGYSLHRIDDSKNSVGAGDAERVRLLMAAGMEVNANDTHGRPALITASAPGHVAIVKILLAKSAGK